MIVAGLILLAGAAAALGLRTLHGRLEHIRHPADWLALAFAAGLLWLVLGLWLSASLGVLEAGLGLAVSLAPVGAFDLARWWVRSRGQRSPWLMDSGAGWRRLALRWLFLAGLLVAAAVAVRAMVPPAARPL